MSSVEPPDETPDGQRGVSDDDLADLVAYDTGTLDASTRAHVESRLSSDTAYVAALAATRRLRRSTTSITEEAPSFSSLSGPWNAATASTPLTPLTPVIPIDEARSRRRPLLGALSAVAAVTALVVTGFVVLDAVSDDSPEELVQPTIPVPVTDPDPNAATTTLTTPDSSPDSSLDSRPVDDVLVSAPRRVLRLASAATVDARTVRLDLDGTGLLSFDGAVLGRSGERIDVGIELGGDGEIVFAEGDVASSDSRIRTEFVGVSGPEVARPELTISEVVRVDGRIFRSDDGIRFTEGGDDDPGALGLLVGRPDLLGRLDTLAVGDIEDLGVEQIDGVDHRHLRFVASEELFDSENVPAATIDVWISSLDQTVRRYVLTVDGPTEVDGLEDATILFEFVTDVTETGDDITIEIPG